MSCGLNNECFSKFFVIILYLFDSCPLITPLGRFWEDSLSLTSYIFHPFVKFVSFKKYKVLFSVISDFALHNDIQLALAAILIANEYKRCADYCEF